MIVYIENPIECIKNSSDDKWIKEVNRMQGQIDKNMVFTILALNNEKMNLKMYEHIIIIHLEINITKLHT